MPPQVRAFIFWLSVIVAIACFVWIAAMVYTSTLSALACVPVSLIVICLFTMLTFQ